MVKKKVGRPTKYTDDYPERLIKHFDIKPFVIRDEVFYYKNGDEKHKEIEVANALPTIEGFCAKVGIAKDTFHAWVKKHANFSYAYKKIKNLQYDIWFKNSIKGLYPGAFTIFTGKNIFGWRDKQEIEHSGEVNAVINIGKPNTND